MINPNDNTGYINDYAMLVTECDKCKGKGTRGSKPCKHCINGKYFALRHPLNEADLTANIAWQYVTPSATSIRLICEDRSVITLNRPTR